MKKSIGKALNTLLNVAIDTKDVDSFWSYVDVNQEEVAKALQLIADTDNEGMLDAGIMALWKVCPTELEEHLVHTMGNFLNIIAIAWQEHGQDVDAAITALLADDNDEQDEQDDQPPVVGKTNTVEFLNNCLSLNL